MGNNGDSMLSFLAVRRMNIGIYDKLDDTQKYIYMNKLKKDIDDEMKAKAFQECILNRYRSYYNKKFDEGAYDEELPLIKEINEDIKKKDEETEKSPYLFITVNPEPGKIGLTEFKKLCEKANSKSCLKKSLYVLEQRGEIEEMAGDKPHAHFLVNKGDYRVSHLKREFASTFRKCCDVSNPGCLNIRICKEKDLANRQNYILADKKDPDKKLKQDMDKIWRRREFIKDYYGETYDTDIAAIAAGL